MQAFNCAGKKERIHVCTSYEELSHFNDSAYELDVLTFAFKIDFDNIEMCCKIHANNLIFKFFLYLKLINDK